MECRKPVFLRNPSFYLIVHSSDLKKKNWGVRPLDITLVEQVGDDSWWVVYAALCHMALVFTIRHLYNFLLLFFLLFLIYFVMYSHIPLFYFILFFNLVSIN